MKPNIKAGASVFLGVSCSFLILDMAKLDYNFFRGTFVLWKAVVKIATPMLFVFLWHWIFQIASRGEHK